MKNFPGYIFFGKNINQPNKRTQVKAQLSLSFKALEKTGQWINLVVEGIQFGGAVPSLRLAFSLALAVISELITMAAQVSWWRDATTKYQEKDRIALWQGSLTPWSSFLHPYTHPDFQLSSWAGTSHPTLIEVSSILLYLKIQILVTVSLTALSKKLKLNQLIKLVAEKKEGKTPQDLHDLYRNFKCVG